MDLMVASERNLSLSLFRSSRNAHKKGNAGRECVSDHGKAACADLGGVCRTERDGYYWVSTLCIAAGAFVLLSYVQPAARRLQCTFCPSFSPVSHTHTRAERG